MRNALLVLGILGALCYFSAVNNPFVHDDVVFILQNPKVHDFSNVAEVFTKSSFAFQSIAVANPYYRPFLDIFYRLEYYVFGPAPQGYHVVNILLHIVNAVFIFMLSLRLTKRQSLSWCVAAFFLVHPVQSEAVACISGISNLLFTFFLLGAFLLYLKITDRDFELSLMQEAFYFSAALFLFACALLCKEQAIILPLLLLLYEFCFPNVVGNNSTSWRLRLTGFVIVSGGYFLWRKMIIGGFIPVFISNWGEFYLRLKSFPAMMMNHIQTIFLPADLHYYRSYDILSPWVLPCIFFSCLGIISILIWRILPENRRPLFGFGLGWFAVTILPTSIIPLVHEYSLIAAFDHFLYLPLAGFLWSVLIVADYFTDQIFHRHSRVVKKFFITAGMIFGVLITNGQAQMWSGEVSLFERAVKYENKMGRLHLLLAKAYYQQRNYTRSRQEYEIARDIMAGYLGKIRDKRVQPFYEEFLRESFLGLAACSEAAGNYQQAEQDYQKVLLLIPDDPAVLNNLGVIAIRLGQLRQAGAYFQKALEIDPGFVPAGNNLEHLSQGLQYNLVPDDTSRRKK